MDINQAAKYVEYLKVGKKAYDGLGVASGIIDESKSHRELENVCREFAQDGAAENRKRVREAFLEHAGDVADIFSSPMYTVKGDVKGDVV